MQPGGRYTLLVTALPEIVADLNGQVAYASLAVVDEQTLQLWTTGRRAGLKTQPPETGVTLRVWDGAKFLEWGSNVEDPDRVRAWALDRVATVKPVAGGEEWPSRAEEAQTFVGPCEVEPATVPLDTKFTDLEVLHGRIVGAHPEVVSGRAVYDETSLFKAFADPNRYLQQTLRFVGASFAVFASDNRQTRYAFGGNKLCGGYELLSRVASQERVDRAVKQARDALRAEKVPPGNHVLVTAPQVSATVAHEAFGHGVEMDMLAKKCARAGAYFDRPVASKLVDMHDAPGLPNSAGFSYFDDEGELSRTTKILDKGVLRSGLTDGFAAWKLGMARSPNGRRESFRRKVYSRMTNTYFAPGSSDPADILSETDSGIYLTGGGVGMEDPLGWGIQIDVRLGYEIRSGALTGRVYSPVGLTGYVPDLLLSIDRVGSDLETYGFGKCGKTFRKDWILVGMGGPTLRMEGRLA